MTNSTKTRGRTSVICERLSQSRRRYLLECLHDAGQPLALADLAENVAEREAEARFELDDEFVKDVYMSLYHTHVPKLAETTLVEYNQERDEVKLIEYPAERESIEESRALLAN